VSNLPIIDPEAIASLKELNPGDGGEFLREIVSIYTEDTPKRLAELRSSLAAGDVNTFARAAHTIKGSSSNVGAAALRAVSERLEIIARKDGLAGVAPLVADCEREFEQAKAELQRLSAG
jgi:HPt (histidine-containing phosphotransfer) domain-containing protein